jgi:uncharacterized membrane protein YfhO
VRILRYTANRVQLATFATAPTVLVFSENYYPAWQARVDGQPQPLYRVNGTLRGIALEPGQHTVEMVYQDRAFELGAGLAGLTLLAAIGGLVYSVLSDRARQRRTAPQ